MGSNQKLLLLVLKHGILELYSFGGVVHSDELLVAYDHPLEACGVAVVAGILLLRGTG